MSLQKFDPTPRKNVAILEPDLACSSNIRDRNLQTLSSSPSFKCNQTGHFKKDCKEKTSRIRC